MIEVPEPDMNPPEYDDRYDEPEFDSEKYYNEKYGTEEYEGWLDRRYRGIVRRDLNEALVTIGSINEKLDKLAESPHTKDQAE